MRPWFADVRGPMTLTLQGRAAEDQHWECCDFKAGRGRAMMYWDDDTGHGELGEGVCNAGPPVLRCGSLP
ncbi:hypothetical protein NicSoilC5_19250 [Arthrobacter sp. NicSoilC5]|nr:hypothetical protein NicSoilC5_19250 [Arthrobacter sp. NicSoilC5]